MKYLLNDNQRKFIEEIFKENQKKIENIKREKYNPDNIFKNTKEPIYEKEKHINSIIAVKEEKWYIKIFKLIKNLLKRK